MSREPKKKPGDMAKARAKHLQNQARREALAKLRNGETVELWVHYNLGSAKVVVKPYRPRRGDNVLAVFSRRLRVMLANEKRGNHWMLSDLDRNGVVPSDQVFGVVTQILEVKEASQ